MFCSKCGAKMAETAKFCSNCAWPNSELVQENPQPIVEVKTPEMHQPTVTVKVPEVPVIPQMPEKQTAPVQKQKSSKPKKKHKKLTAFLIIFVLVLGALGTGAYFFAQSDFHKTLVAEKYIAEDSFDKAMRVLHDAESDKAKVLIKYIDVENAKNDFLSSAEGSGYKAAINDMDDFRKQVKSLKNSDIHLLSDELIANVNCYYEAVNYVDRSFETDYSLSRSEIMKNLNRIQYVMLNEVIRNNSEEDVQTFTLEQLQANMDISSDADEYLKQIDFKFVDVSSRSVKENCFLVKNSEGKVQNKVQIGSKTLSTINTMLSCCRQTLAAYEKYMKESAEKYEMDDELYLSSPEQNYSSYVGEKLERIYSEEDISENAEIIQQMIKKDVLYYLVTGKTSS